MIAQLSFGPAPAAPGLAVAAARSYGIDLRPARDADLPLLFAVYAHTRLDELAATGWPEAVKQAFLEQQFAAQHCHYQAHYDRTDWLVIDRNGSAAGRLYVAYWDEEIRIVDIALLPAARGTGIGGAILTDLAALGRRTARPLTIHVERHNPARRLYLRHGFVPAGDAGAYELMRRPHA